MRIPRIRSWTSRIILCNIHARRSSIFSFICEADQVEWWMWEQTFWYYYSICCHIFFFSLKWEFLELEAEPRGSFCVTYTQDDPRFSASSARRIKSNDGCENKRFDTIIQYAAIFSFSAWNASTKVVKGKGHQNNIVVEDSANGWFGGGSGGRGRVTDTIWANARQMGPQDVRNRRGADLRARVLITGVCLIPKFFFNVTVALIRITLHWTRRNTSLASNLQIDVDGECNENADSFSMWGYLHNNGYFTARNPVKSLD
jgi:hypothetical protein